MRLPRDETGRSLAKRLEALGYVVARQRGSHIRLETGRNGVHAITVPDHVPLKLGTLQGIFRELEQHHGMSRVGRCNSCCSGDAWSTIGPAAPIL